MASEAPEVRPATVDDVAALQRVLARAFMTDPCLQWIFRDGETRLERLEALFAGAGEFFVSFGGSFATTDLSGAALWGPPGTFPQPEPEPAPAGEVAPPAEPAPSPFLPDEADRLATFLGLMGDHHPKERHWYLGILAADPGRQGQGIGSACMRPVLERCDAEGVPAYLESTNGRNVPLYERHGFWVTDVLDLPEGPPVWTMWREPISVRVDDTPA